MKSFALKEAILYSQSGKCGKCFTNQQESSKIFLSVFCQGLGLLRHLTFLQETFRHGHFNTGTFLHRFFRLHRCSGTWTVHLRGRFSTGTFWHGEFSVHGKWTIRYPAIQYGRFGTCAETSMEPKSTLAEKFP